MLLLVYYMKSGCNYRFQIRQTVVVLPHAGIDGLFG